MLNEYYNDYDQTNEPTIQYRFLVPQAAAGGIIGRKGDNIKRLRATHMCDISVPACDAPERLMLLTGNSLTLRNVISEVLDMVKDCMHAKINDPKDINNSVIPDNPYSPEMDLRFLVSENVCGAIIGKGGEVIRGLTDTYKVSVFKVYQQMCPNSSDRVIRLVGNPDDILNCLVAIHDIILGLKDVKSLREYDPVNFNEMHAVNYGGWISLDGRRRLAQLGGPLPPTKGPTESGHNETMMSQQNTQYFPPAQIRATPSFLGMPIGHMADYVHPDCILMEIESEMFQKSTTPHPVSSVASPVGSGPIDVSHVSLPNKLIGAIMGRGGCRINDIREETGARIDVDKDVMPNSDDRIITIQGTREQIQKAQALLQSNVKRYGGRY